MTVEEVFKILIDSTESPLKIEKYDGDTLKILYSFFGIESEGNYLSKVVVEKLRDKIYALLFCDTPYSDDYMNLLLKQIVIGHLVDGSSLQPYFGIASFILEEKKARKGFIIPIDESETWKEAIGLIKLFFLLNPSSSHLSDELGGAYNRLVVMCSAIKYFREKGYKIDVVDGRVNDIDDNIIGDIEKTVLELGGINVASYIFRLLPYDDKTNRYIFRRSTSLTGQMATPDIPYGYLLNLCAKYINPEAAMGSDFGDKFNALLELTTYYIALYDLQSYNFWEDYFINKDNFRDVLVRNVLYDNVFWFIQMNPKYAIDIFINIFTWIDRDKFSLLHGYDFSAIIRLYEVFFRDTGTHKGPIAFSNAQIAGASGLDIETVNRIIGSFSHERSNINKGYRSPLEFTECDFYFKPFIRMKNNEYVMLDIRWCTTGFYEAIMSLLRVNAEKNRQPDDMIGTAFEDYLKEVLTQKGISYYYGVYDNMPGKEDGECDLIIEAEKSVFLFELKKKVMTRTAREGRDVNILIDIQGSLFESQQQTGMHQNQLLKYGYLTLKEGNTGRVKTIHLKGREIERVSVSFLTLSEFGSMHDRVFIQKIMEQLLIVDFYPLNDAYKEKFNEFRTLCESLRKQYSELITLDSRCKENPYFNCWYLTCQQLLYLFEDINSNNDLDVVFKNIKFVSTGSRDVIYEYSMMKRT